MFRSALAHPFPKKSEGDQNSKNGQKQGEEIRGHDPGSLNNSGAEAADAVNTKDQTQTQNQKSFPEFWVFQVHENLLCR